MGLFSKKEACPVCDSEVKGLFNKKIGGKKGMAAGLGKEDFRATYKVVSGE